MAAGGPPRNCGSTGDITPKRGPKLQCGVCDTVERARDEGMYEVGPTFWSTRVACILRLRLAPNE